MVFIIHGKSSGHVFLFSQALMPPKFHAAMPGHTWMPVQAVGCSRGDELWTWGFITCSKQRQSCSFSGLKTLAHPSRSHIANTLRNRFTMSENSLSQHPGSAGLWLDATRRGLLWALETEEKWKHCPLASGCGQAEAQPAGCGRGPCCGFQVASSDHPGDFSWGQLPTIPAFPDFLIFAFSASNSLHEIFSKYLRWLLFLCPHTNYNLKDCPRITQLVSGRAGFIHRLLQQIFTEHLNFLRSTLGLEPFSGPQTFLLGV